jgi:hypothetical protein
MAHHFPVNVATTSLTVSTLRRTRQAEQRRFTSHRNFAVSLSAQVGGSPLQLEREGLTGVLISGRFLDAPLVSVLPTTLMSVVRSTVRRLGDGCVASWFASPRRVRRPSIESMNFSHLSNSTDGRIAVEDDLETATTTFRHDVFQLTPTFANRIHVNEVVQRGDPKPRRPLATLLGRRSEACGDTLSFGGSTYEFLTDPLLWGRRLHDFWGSHIFADRHPPGPRTGYS